MLLPDLIQENWQGIQSKEASLILFVSLCPPMTPEGLLGEGWRVSKAGQGILPPLSTCPTLAPSLMWGEVAGLGPARLAWPWEAHQNSWWCAGPWVVAASGDLL